MNPIVPTYITIGIIIGAAGAWNLFTHSSGNRLVIAGVCSILWAGLVLLWPLGIVAWLILEQGE